VRTSRIQFARPVRLALSLVVAASGTAAPHSGLRGEAQPAAGAQTADSGNVGDILNPRAHPIRRLNYTRWRRQPRSRAAAAV
jgi:hypothetical protein